MTRLTLNKNPGEKFAARGRNTATGLEDDSAIFYNEITKAHVVPERETFTIQVVAPDVEVEMDFANAQEVREALAQFEGKRVLEVDCGVPNSVRITPLASQRSKK
ncbi:MAG: hypothetical protein WB696_05600 [Chthoniobacterales bacterium]